MDTRYIVHEHVVVSHLSWRNNDYEKKKLPATVVQSCCLAPSCFGPLAVPGKI